MIPFSDADFVGPDDRPKYESPLELTMVGWRVRSTVGLKDALDSIALGGVATAVRCAPKVEAGAIVCQPCPPHTDKAHKLTLSPDHKTVSWSLFAPLRKFGFQKANDDHKVIFQCRVQESAQGKALIIDVANYRVERVVKAEQAEDADEE